MKKCAKVMVYAALSGVTVTSCSQSERSVESTAIPVELVERDGRYQLFRDGLPYAINGAGIEFGDVERFAAHGGTSFRTWRTDNDQNTGQQVLDEAQANGLTVVLCIEIGRERLGFDYDDDDAVAAQLEYAREEVLKYKDHPALLAWMISNEPNLEYTNPKIFDAIDDISRMIHEVDGNHPTTTALAGFDAHLAEVVAKRAADLDFVSIQMYGDIVNLPDKVAAIGYDKPFMVTEWGAIGHWEVQETDWGAPIEQNSSDKAANYLKSYRVAIESNPRQIVGAYVFLWGDKQERTPTWYGMFLSDGTETETVDVMHYIWNDRWPDNRAPTVDALSLDDKEANDSVTLVAAGSYAAKVTAADPDNDPLEYRWEVMRESITSKTGGDKEEVPETLPGLVSVASSGSAELRAPDEPGAYRLFVYVHDGNGKAGHANIPFYVQP